VISQANLSEVYDGESSAASMGTRMAIAILEKRIFWKHLHFQSL